MLDRELQIWRTHIDGFGMDVLIGLLDLLELRRRTEVRHDQTIVTKRIVRRAFIDVAPVSKDGLSPRLLRIFPEIKRHHRIRSIRQQLIRRERTRMDRGFPNRTTQAAGDLLGMDSHPYLEMILECTRKLIHSL